MPGLPGFFPLSISSPQVTAPRSGGPARLSSILSALRCSAASHFPVCSTPIHPSTRSSPNRDDDESDNLAPFNAYPNAYGVWPLLAGERAHYELAAGNAAEAARLLSVLEA